MPEVGSAQQASEPHVGALEVAKLRPNANQTGEAQVDGLGDSNGDG